MANLGMTEFADALKINYIDPLNDQIYRKNVLLNRLEKNSEDVDGKFAYVPLITARNVGMGSRADTSGTGPKLPSPGRQSYGKLTFAMAYHYGRGAVSGPSMRASKNRNTSFVNSLDAEMKGLAESLPEELNRMAWSYGHGRRATLQANMTASSTFFYARADAVFNARVGDRVHIANITSGAISTTWPNGTTVSSIELDFTTLSGVSVHRVTLAAAAAAITATAASEACYGGAETSMTSVDSSRANEMFGIMALVDDGDLGADEAVAVAAGEVISGSITLPFGATANRGTTSILQSPVLKNPDSAGTNRPLTTALMEQAYLRATVIEGANPQDIEIYTNPSLWSTFGLLHVGDRIYNDYMETMESGFIALKFNGRPVFADKDAPRDMIWFLDMSTLMLLTQTGYQFLDEDGGKIRNVAGYDTWDFTLVRDCQLGIRKFRTNVRLDDLTATNIIQGVN